MALVITFFKTRECLLLLIKLCDLSGNHYSSKAPYIIDPQNV